MSCDDALTKNVLHRNLVHITIDEVIVIPEAHIRRTIVDLYSNYNYNYNSSSSVLSFLFCDCLQKFKNLKAVCNCLGKLDHSAIVTSWCHM
jgi:hypothetical protein